jgi:tetratricopeptide (TPR) repeat protein
MHRMRRLRSLLLTSSIAVAALAPGATAWAQGKPSQPPTPAGTSPAKPSGTSPSSAPTPKPGGTAAPATTGTASTTKPPSGTSTGSSSAGTGTGTGTGTAAGTGTQTGTATTTPAEPAPADSAETLFRRGNELAKKDGWDKAEPLYRAAWKLKQSYDIAANLGLALFQQQKWRESAEFLAFALRSFPASGKPENRALLESAFSQVKAEVATLAIDVSVNGANVSVDGRAVGVSPIKDPVFADPGKRTIDVTHDEYTPSHKTVEAAKGSTQDVKIVLSPKPKTPPPMISSWRPSPIYFIIGGSVVIAGLGAGVVLTAVSNGKSSDADSLRNRFNNNFACYQPTAANAAACGELHETLKDQGLFARAAVGSFAVAGIFAVGTGALMLYAGSEQFGPKSEAGSRSTAQLRLLPVVDSTQKGLLVVGAW